MSTEVKTNSISSRIAWNKGRLVGQKRPLRPKEVWAIRVRLQMKHRKRDLALFNLAIDSKLRGCDLVSLRVDDIAAGGSLMVQSSGCFECGLKGRPGVDDGPEDVYASAGERDDGLMVSLSFAALSFVEGAAVVGVRGSKRRTGRRRA